VRYALVAAGIVTALAAAYCVFYAVAIWTIYDDIREPIVPRWLSVTGGLGLAAIFGALAVVSLTKGLKRGRI
jgi:hypothetical protein